MNATTQHNPTPKYWRDMTPEEKGALLLAHHEGKEIEVYDTEDGWVEAHHGWFPHEAYRVRPEPKREIENVTIVNADGMAIGHGTVVTYNGKPDLNSLKITNGSDCAKAC